MQQMFLSPRSSAGQTLIETMAAAFILVMGVSASVGLAIYALHSSGSVVKQIIATGLAREGLEAVRNMRDTNWLQQTTMDTNCYNFASNPVGQATANCYSHWLDQTFCINPTNNNGNCNGNGVGSQYYLGFDSSLANFWTISKNKNNELDYGLNFDPNNSGTTGFYSSAGGVGCDSNPGRSDYCRKIIITKINNVEPYNHDTNLVLLQVQSQVWWTDQNCPRVADFTPGMRCSVELDTYLTNWKNYH